MRSEEMRKRYMESAQIVETLDADDDDDGLNAARGVGVGPQGSSYAIPTKDRNLYPLTLATKP